MVSEPSTTESFEIFEGLFGQGQRIEANSPLDATKHLQYWRKCSGCAKHTQELGWITLGPVMSKYTAQEYYDFQQNKHATPLTQYGQYPAGRTSAGEKSKYNVVEPEFRFQPLIELGGVREVPIDQMVAYNWHRNPVLVKYIPQLGEVVDYPCTFGCANRVFTSQETLRTHISVKHQNVEQPQAIGQEIAKAIEASSGNNFNPEIVATIVAAVSEAMKPKL